MSVEITVTVNITGGNGKSTVNFNETRTTADGNPMFYATSAEGGLVDASRSILDQIIRLYGDIRDEDPEPGSLTDRALARVLTAPRNGQYGGRPASP